jgi:hypothetical protein
MTAKPSLFSPSWAKVIEDSASSVSRETTQPAILDWADRPWGAPIGQSVRVGAPTDDVPDLEALDPLPPDHQTSVTPSERTRPRRRWRVVATVVFLSLLVALLWTGLEIRDLNRRVAQLQSVARARAATTASATTVAPRPSYRYCLSSPLVGQLTYTPGAMLGSLGQIRGNVGGFPAQVYVEADLVDRTVIPARVIQQLGFVTSSSGAQRVEQPTFVDPSATVSQITFRAFHRPTDDLRSYGPPANRC